MISVQDLSFRYPGSDSYALHHINLEVKKGDWVVVVGPSGCGKSTLTLALGGFLCNQYPDLIQGKILIDGLDVREIPLYEIADHVGLVQQNPETQFCTLMVEDELVFGLENRKMGVAEIEKRIDWALEITGCQHLRKRSLTTLSGGEKQKIAIAAMLAAKPAVLIFDEPTSNLDPTATEEIFKVIQHIREKTAITVVVIEHKIQFLRKFSPRLIEMRDARIVRDQKLVDWQPPEYIRPGTGFVPVKTEPLLTIKNLQVEYDHTQVLKDLSLDVYPGEFVAVMGDNGSGKSTLLQSIANLVKPINGDLFLFGKNTSGLPVSAMASSLGYVFQNPAHQLFESTVWGEAIFASRNFTNQDPGVDQRAETMLRESGLEGRLKDHPFRLSYGQMRRLNLVSVFVYQPRLFLLDELLIGQDVENGMFLLTQLQSVVNQGSAVMMVNHNPDAVKAFATRIVYLEKGRFLFDLEVEAGFARLAELGKKAYLPASWQLLEEQA